MLIFLHDGSSEGVFTCVYNAFESKDKPGQILNADMTSQNLLDSYVYFAPDHKKADQLYKAAGCRISSAAQDLIYTVSLSCEPDAGGSIFNYLDICFKKGTGYVFAYGEEAILKAWQIRNNVMTEYHRYLGFLRFKKIGQEVYYAPYEPRNNLNLLLAEHFSDRMKNEKWIIHDKTRNKAVIYDLEKYFEVPFIGRDKDSILLEDDRFEKLWKEFLESVTISERTNYRLQLNNMPKRYRKYMTESI